MSTNSFDAKATLSAGGRDLEIFRLDALQSRFDVARLPYSLKILLENLLRTEGNGAVTAGDIEALASWDAKADPSREIAFTPARVVMQDFTGVPAIVDLAAMRDAMAALGGDPAKIEPLVPAELVIDHSVQVDAFGTADAAAINAEREFERNRERYQFLVGPAGVRDVQGRPAGHRHRPPGQPRIPLARRVRGRPERPGVPRHPRRHGLAHDDDQRARPARVGRRRHRGGGGDARPADPDADPAGGRHAPRRRAAGGGDRDRPRAHRDRAAARDRRRRQVRRVLRPGHLAAAARRPRDARQHEPRVRLDLRDLPDRRRDAALPGVHGPPGRAGRARRGLREGAGPLARRARRGPHVLEHGRPGPRHRRALARRAAPPAGPRAAAPRAGDVPRRAHGLRRRRRRAGRGGRRELSRERSAGRADARLAGAGDPHGGRPRHARDRGAAERDDARHARRRDADRARARARRDRRHHELHEHLQPLGDARPRACSRATPGRAG